MSAGGIITIFPGDRNDRIEVLHRERRTLFCRCDCGQFKSISSSNFRRTKNCGCESERHKDAEAYQHQITALLTIYQRNALQRDRDFSLTRDEFISLISARCHYCGSPPSSFIRTKRDKRLSRPGLAYNGIDREQPSIGYTRTNSRPCCSVCNYAKGKMTAEAFLLHCTRVAAWALTAPRSVFD